MTIEVKNSVKPVDYLESIEILEKRVDDVLAGKKNELMWILEHNTVYTGGTSSNNKDLIFYGDGYQTRDWIHVKDIIKAFSLVLENSLSNFEIITLGSGIQNTLWDLFNYFCDFITNCH